MGDRDIVLLRGHGIAAVGDSVQAATGLAIRFEHLAEIVWQLVLSGRYEQISEIPEADKLRYGPERVGGPPLTEGGEEGGGWRMHLIALEAGVGLPSVVEGDD